MIFVFLLILLVAGRVSPLGLIEQPPVLCYQEGVPCNFTFCGQNCSDKGWVKPRKVSPGLPGVKVEVSSRADQSAEKVPVLILTFTLPTDGSIYTLQGTEVHVLEVATNSSLCVRYIFNEKFKTVATPDKKPWSFTLDRIMVQPGLKYQVSVSNLPKPDVGRHAEVRHITVVGCKDPTMGRLKVCLENGSLWDPNLTWSVSDNNFNGKEIAVTFNTGQFSERYRVGLHLPNFHPDHMVLKDNRSSINVTFHLDAMQIKHCEFVVVIKPFFVRCMNNCLEYQQKVQICSGSTNNIYYMLWTVFGLVGLILCAYKAHKEFHSNSKDDSYMSSNDTTDMEEEKIHSIQRPSKVLIIYSLDHLLYKEIVLKLCAFLRARCGTDVMLDLLDFTQLSTIGSIQWLEMQRDRMSGSSDKVLILCSPGVFAKWRAMCGGNKVMTREDIQSPMGDMLTPALSLIIPDFVHASSYQKYIVAYFDDICSETDIPAPLNVAVKYQLMKHFEELFFRLVDKEKHEPGSIKQVEGIGGDDYFNSLQGIALKNAIEAFQAYQLANPNWFEMELVDTDVEIEPRGHKPDESADVACNCVLQNQLWVMDGIDPVLINNLEGQTDKWENGLTEITNFFDEGYYASCVEFKPCNKALQQDNDPKGKALLKNKAWTFLELPSQSQAVNPTRI
ncbi:interleukin-17 receptor A [Astyanax mexicanus]|uniref:interleukin-17 receptor A n=1 Tax=Astyanax mexicanus TaxID=7994 RepID=UPI0020CAA5FD|nr:interleukin-17 receptor A [Astyanax mexicanus]